MYRHINQHIEPVLNVLRDEDLVPQYNSLMCRFAEADAAKDPEFQTRYATFWRFHPGLSPQWRARYFELLGDIRVDGAQLDLRQICQQTLSRRTGQETQSIQFSFATKLAHMVNTELPIYDRNVRAFYLLTEPNGNTGTRTTYYLRIYDRLVKEYARVREKRVLNESINRFRTEFHLDKSFTDVKIIDSLIWAFVKWAGPAFLAGKFHYE